MPDGVWMYQKIRIAEATLRFALHVLLFNQNMPRSDNRGCRNGLALSFSLHEDACVVSEHIGRYSTPCMKYVNDFMGDISKLVFQKNYP